MKLMRFSLKGVNIIDREKNRINSVLDWNNRFLVYRKNKKCI